jgi:hypothetical protein
VIPTRLGAKKNSRSDFSLEIAYKSGDRLARRA